MKYDQVSKTYNWNVTKKYKKSWLVRLLIGWKLYHRNTDWFIAKFYRHLDFWWNLKDGILRLINLIINDVIFNQ